MLFYNVTLLLSHLVVKSISPLESGKACDYFHQQNTAEVMLWEVRGWVIKGNPAFTLLDGTHACARSLLKVFLCWDFYAVRKSKHTVKPCTVYTISAQVTDMLVHKPSDDSSPHPLSHPQIPSLTGWGPRYHRAETSHAHSAPQNPWVW